MKIFPSVPRDIFTAKPSDTLMLTGNEAYTRGLVEAGVKFFTTYPGTPCSEIGDNWAVWVKENPKISFLLAANETVAFEAAVGAAWSGVRSAVAFKHLGMNLIADALHTVMYAGIEGKRQAGLVIICGGDPDCLSSTNAEDIRMYCFHAKIPLLEPSTVQDCRDFVLLAFLLSEKWDLPILIYSPAQLNHAWGFVNIGIPGSIKEVKDHIFIKNFEKFNNAIHWARLNQRHLNQLIHSITFDSYPSDLPMPLSVSEGQLGVQLNERASTETSTIEKKTVGIIAAGWAWTAVEECCFRLKSDIPRLRLFLTYPINRGIINEFIHQFQLDTLLIVEELEPLLELQIKSYVNELSLPVRIIGKAAVPQEGALSPDIVFQAFGTPFLYGDKTIVFQEFSEAIRRIPSEVMQIQSNLPIREPTFCPGCSHRNVFYALRQAAIAFQKETGKEPIYGGDIGCYTMSMSEPYSTVDWLVCMGAGVGVANGVARVVDKQQQHVITVIGDSTFFHSGLQPLLNLALENIPITVLLLDNYFCAMTGDQLSPSTPAEFQSPEIKPISIPGVLTALGNPTVIHLDGYSIKAMIRQIKQAFSLPGTKVILVEAECALNKKRRIKGQAVQESRPRQGVNIFITEYCSQCNECYEKLGCTAIENIAGQYQIDPSRCMQEHCGSCIEICPNRAIRKTIINPHLKSVDKSDPKEEM